MYFKAFKAVLLLVAGGMASPALAQKSVLDEGQCPGVLPYGEASPIALMRVSATSPRVQFIESRSKTKPQCPSDAAACQRKAFVVPEDEVLVLPSRDGFACTSFIAPGAKKVKGTFPETHGYLPAGALTPVRMEFPATAAWLGTWTRSAEAEITILPGMRGQLMVKGEATFGALDPGRIKRGAVNMGELEGHTAPRGNMLALGEGYDGTKALYDDTDRSDCKARLRLYGRYLVVEDNLGCGGMNVSFSGIYVRLK